MRSFALATILFLGLSTGAVAQKAYSTPYSGDAALTYHWVRTNATPGECGCFGLNGGGASGSYNIGSGLAGVVEISAETAGNVFSEGRSLTLTSYLGGARYYLPQPWLQGSHGPQPFVQALVGGAHAGGSVAGSGDGTYAFNARIGGGIDVPLNSFIAIRAIQIDYDLTRFSNLANDHQNNLLLGFGVVFHWSRQK